MLWIGIAATAVVEATLPCAQAAARHAAPSTPLAADPEGVIAASLAHDAARQLGTHYLRRYFLIITYR
jgi:hypothetical protein